MGSTENARPDKDRPRKTGDLTLQDLTITDQNHRGASVNKHGYLGLSCINEKNNSLKGV